MPLSTLQLIAPERWYLSRLIVSCVLFLGVVAISFPLFPWVEQQVVPLWIVQWLAVDTQSLPLVRHALVMSGLLLVGMISPKQQFAEGGMPLGLVLILGTGILCLSEPFVHIGLLLAAGGMPHAMLVDLVLPRPTEMADSTLLLQQMCWWVIIPAVTEEFVFRARLLPLLVRGFGTWSGLTLSACIFALVHGSIPQMIVSLPLGFLFGWLRLQHQSWYPSVLVHGLHNGLLLLAGGAMTTSPALHLLLVCVGAWLLVYGWQVRQGSTFNHVQLCIRGGLMVAVLLLAWPWWRQAQDQAWARAVQAICGHERYAMNEIMRRLLYLQQRRQLPERRQFLLRMTADTLPDERETCLRAVIDTDALLAEALATEPALDPRDDAVYLLLEELSVWPLQHTALSNTIQRLAAARPVVFATFMRDAPTMLPVWLPIPQHTKVVGAIIGVLQARDRLGLSGLLFGLYKPEVAARCLLTIPADQVLPSDKARVRRYVRDAEGFIRAELQGDPERLKVWLP